MDLCRTLSVLDLFDAFEAADTKQTAAFEEGKLGVLAKDFLRKGKADLVSRLRKTIGLDLTRSESNGRAQWRLIDPETKKPVSCARVRECVEGVEKRLEEKGIFDYEATITKVVAACVRFIEGCIGSELKKCGKDLSGIKVNSIQSSGADFMVQYEVSFMASASEKTITFPNFDKLTDAHVEFAMKNYQRGKRKCPGRMRRALFFWLYDRSCHEIFHIVQGVIGQQDPHKYSMSAEHDASIPAYSLLWAISQDAKVKDIFPPGFAEEVLSKTMSDDADMSAKWSPEVATEYKGWRDAFGLTFPSDKTCEDNVLVSSFCGRVSSDYFTKANEELAEIIGLLFNERTGDVHKVKREAPKKLCRGIKRWL